MAVIMNYQIIGMNVKEHREKQSLTQAQLAELAGISLQFLGNIECGRGIPSVKTVMSLCDALNLNSDSLLSRSAAHDFAAPCTLREDHDVFPVALSDMLLTPETKGVYSIRLEDLPAFDIDLDEGSNL